MKAGNVLVGSNGSVCLADFGIIPTGSSGASNPSKQSKQSRQSKQSKQSSLHVVGTPCWMAPEIVSESAYAAPVLFVAIMN